jgi:hypothetical protein
LSEQGAEIHTSCQRKEQGEPARLFLPIDSLRQSS